MRTVLYLLTYITAVAVIAPATNADDRATPERCRELQESLMDFYLPSVDPIHGGYMQELDADEGFTGTEKFLTLQARQLWYFSTLAVNDIRRKEALDAARSGYEFLIAHFHDEIHGGFVSKTTRDGKPLDTRKHIYPNAFVVYGLVEYHRATGDSEPLEHAKQLFRILEKHCYDHKFGGYQEFSTKTGH